jgi:hypothetical protein
MIETVATFFELSGLKRARRLGSMMANLLASSRGTHVAVPETLRNF